MEKAADILKTLLGDNQMKEAKLYSSFFGSWKDIAGDKAAHSRITDIVRNAAIIEVDHPGWMQLLKMDEKKILGILQKRYPELDIRSLRFVLGNRTGKPVLPREEEPKKAERKDEAALSNAETAESMTVDASGSGKNLDGIHDPKLKMMLKNLGKAIDERQQ